MGHTPYGYRIENGVAVVNENEAQCVKRIFDNYISGMSLSESAKAAGHPIVHSSIKRILSRACYCGDDFYPAIINKATFHKANEELKKRAADMNQTRKTRRTTPKPQTEFVLGLSQMHYDDPYEQAEYLYSLIESKVVKCQK
ncbi:MAG: recombinase family protein [Ruminococcus flavefaciens]|nr:recombinase family protein [Ruminococcus flavefaciens]MCM1363116.1 recombinase family protein [Clostridiales bacterium]